MTLSLAQKDDKSTKQAPVAESPHKMAPRHTVTHDTAVKTHIGSQMHLFPD